jgi:hypothetical protein
LQLLSTCSSPLTLTEELRLELRTELRLGKRLKVRLELRLELELRLPSKDHASSLYLCAKKLTNIVHM